MQRLLKSTPCKIVRYFDIIVISITMATGYRPKQESPAIADKTRATRKPAKIAPIRRAIQRCR